MRTARPWRGTDITRRQHGADLETTRAALKRHEQLDTARKLSPLRGKRTVQKVGSDGTPMSCRAASSIRSLGLSRLPLLTRIGVGTGFGRSAAAGERGLRPDIESGHLEQVLTAWTLPLASFVRVPNSRVCYPR